MASGRTKSIKDNTRRGPNKEDYEELTVQQRSFIVHLISDPQFNAETAAKKAGYTGNGSGSKLLKNPVIARELSRQITIRNEAMSIKSEDVVAELKDIAFRDIIDLCDETGKVNLTDIRKLPARIRKCIDGLKIRAGYDLEGNQTMTVDLKLVPKMEAMQLLMKHLGMLEPDGMRKPTNEDEGKVVFDWDELYAPPRIEYDAVEAALNTARMEAKQRGEL